MTVIRKNKESLLQELQEITDNEESIQMELETSENMEKELNEKISQLQIRLEQTKKRRGITAEADRGSTSFTCKSGAAG